MGRSRAPQPDDFVAFLVRGMMAALAAVCLCLPSAALADTGTPYRVEIEGVSDIGLRNLLTQTSQLEAMRATPPATLTGLARRAQDDLPRLISALRSQAYYGAGVTYEVNGNQSPAVVRLIVDTGPRYRLRAFDITYDNPVNGEFAHSIEDIDGARGSFATGRYVLDLEAQVIDRLHNRGYPFAEATSRTAQAYVNDARIEVDLVVATGPYARFGTVTIEGLTRTDERYVRQRLAWEHGAPVSREAIRSTQAALSATGLFGNISIELAEMVDSDGYLPVHISLTETAPRTVGVGLRYGTSEGPGARTYWEHRNTFGSGEHLRFEGIVASIEQSLAGSLRFPDFLHPDQSLLLGTSVFNTVTESYDERGVTGSVTVERDITQNLTVQGGLEGRVSVIEEDADRRDTRTIATPIGATYDDTDSALDATEGMRLSLTLTPTFGESETSLFYMITEARATGYYALDPEDRIVLAARMRAGSIFGEQNLDIPASDRFFSGGGGSVRGIGYQLAGPLDMQNDPIGGRSVIELGAEARFRVRDRFGIVPFIEGGSVFTSDVPDFSEDLHWGAGVGFRYYTGFGPIRVDIATPLDRREGIDDVVQVYISLGQAF